MVNLETITLENSASHKGKYELCAVQLKGCLQRHQVKPQRYGEKQIPTIDSDYFRRCCVLLCYSLDNLDNLSFTLKTLFANLLLSFTGGWMNICFAKQVQSLRSSSLRMGPGGLCCFVLYWSACTIKEPGARWEQKISKSIYKALIISVCFLGDGCSNSGLVPDCFGRFQQGIIFLAWLISLVFLNVACPRTYVVSLGLSGEEIL